MVLFLQHQDISKSISRTVGKRVTHQIISSLSSSPDNSVDAVESTTPLVPWLGKLMGGSLSC